ncbi:BrnT family toxin [Tolypothrix sp. FACHB-123]|uniref:BrnT family toxin n=1 Tax=Tolypothrix sp. FACHB-123 TaxID=2692868 RepID=UPI0016887765|nr:BrnT family toxin [Tolypothrix sp. FACHB-123]MBD2355874.1 BrnT family toxin [Tolypothrix sp. FACHB-123]
MELGFEWDEEKAKENLRKHGISFEEAKTVFNDPFAITINDPEHSIDEERFIDIGLSTRGKLLVVVYTERQLNIRIISCRQATKLEQKVYQQS